ncbi:MAG: RibD family protein [Hyphomicrobiaceae bacterium]
MTTKDVPPAAGQANDPIAAIRVAPRDHPFVVAQLGQSLDGRIATLSGESRWINQEAALDHVHRIRAAVDAVVVGIGTVIADDPLLNVRRVPGRHPARVVIDLNGRLSASARMLADDGCRRIVIGRRRAVLSKGVEVIEVPRNADGLDPNAIVAALFEAGLKSLLIEGGAHTVSRFLEAGAVDRLHMLVAPVILGSGKPGLSLKPIARLSQALRPTAAIHVLADGDVIFDCDMRSIREE